MVNDCLNLTREIGADRICSADATLMVRIHRVSDGSQYSSLAARKMDGCSKLRNDVLAGLLILGCLSSMLRFRWEVSRDRVYCSSGATTCSSLAVSTGARNVSSLSRVLL